MATFGLVHGVCAGAWCWEPLVPHLQEAGHDVVAVDLPCEDSAATFSDYADVVVDGLGDSDDVVVVGHSTGGATIPLVAARRPVRELVYLCAVIPAPGKSLADEGFDFRAIEPTEWQVGSDDGSFSIRPDAVSRHVAQDVDPELAAGLAGQLRRQFLAPFLEPCPLEALPDVPSRYILCRDDHIVAPDWSRRMAPERLGVEPIELPGSHSPMASRPRELADVLLSSAVLT
jgi:pimeloyl-ACP methyl ester carboxylesterase